MKALLAHTPPVFNAVFVAEVWIFNMELTVCQPDSRRRLGDLSHTLPVMDIFNSGNVKYQLNWGYQTFVENIYGDDSPSFVKD